VVAKFGAGFGECSLPHLGLQEVFMNLKICRSGGIGGVGCQAYSFIHRMDHTPI
jgi:hypothetical protein